MTQFYYKAVGSDGKIVDGEMEADDRPSVITQLQAAGHLPISAEPRLAHKAFAGLGRRMNRRRARPRTTDVTSFTREIATLLAAGLPLDSALRLLLRHAEQDRMADVIRQVQRDVQAGKALSSALASHADVFDVLYLSLVRAGESSGALETVMTRLATHREQAEAFRSTVIAAVTYPAILLVVAVLSLFVLMSFVVPRFIPLFSDAGSTLPVLTRVVFAVAEGFGRFWWLAVAALLFGKLALDRWLATPANRMRAARGILDLPVIGALVREADTVRFCRTLATLFDNGLPLLSSLKLVKDVMRNEALAAMTERCLESVEGGKRLSQALYRESMLPSLAVELLTIGEESGKLGEMLEKAAVTFEARVEQRLKRLLALIEPVLILGLGTLIGVVIVAILMAMLGLNELIV